MRGSVSHNSNLALANFTVIMFGEVSVSCVEMYGVDGRSLVCLEMLSRDIKQRKPYLLWGKQVKYVLATPRNHPRQLSFIDENGKRIVDLGCRAFFINTWWPPGANDGECAL